MWNCSKFKPFQHEESVHGNTGWGHTHQRHTELTRQQFPVRRADIFSLRWSSIGFRISPFSDWRMWRILLLDSSALTEKSVYSIPTLNKISGLCCQWLSGQHAHTHTNTHYKRLLINNLMTELRRGHDTNVLGLERWSDWSSQVGYDAVNCWSITHSTSKFNMWSLMKNKYVSTMFYTSSQGTFIIATKHPYYYGIYLSINLICLWKTIGSNIKSRFSQSLTSQLLQLQWNILM